MEMNEDVKKNDNFDRIEDKCVTLQTLVNPPPEWITTKDTKIQKERCTEILNEIQKIIFEIMNEQPDLKDVIPKIPENIFNWNSATMAAILGEKIYILFLFIILINMSIEMLFLYGLEVL